MCKEEEDKLPFEDNGEEDSKITEKEIYKKTLAEFSTLEDMLLNNKGARSRQRRKEYYLKQLKKF